MEDFKRLFSKAGLGIVGRLQKMTLLNKLVCKILSLAKEPLSSEGKEYLSFEIEQVAENENKHEKGEEAEDMTAKK